MKVYTLKYSIVKILQRPYIVSIDDAINITRNKPIKLSIRMFTKMYTAMCGNFSTCEIMNWNCTKGYF